MKIVGSVTSPFTRITRVLCEELAIPYEFEITAPFAKLNAEQDAFIASYNPLMKVPALQDGKTVLFDSRIIARYLLSQKANEIADYPEAGSPAEENILTVIFGVMDAGILSFMLKASYPDIDMESGYIARSKERMTSGLAWLSAQNSLGKRFGLVEIVLICGLDWFSKRNVISWREYSGLTHAYDTYAGRESFVKTAIPAAV